MTADFRNATIDDLPSIVSIYNSVIPGRMVTADTEPVSVESRIAWFKEHNPRHRPLWMIMDKEKMVGWVSFQSFYGRPAYNGTAEISIYIAEPERGKGYGRLALGRAMQACNQLGIKTLLGYIFAHNEPSLTLFTKLGFSRWGYFPGIAELDGIERDLIIVGKRVN